MSVVSVRIYFRSAVVAKESHVQQAEHVEGCNERGDDAECPVDRDRLIGLPENFILAPKARQWRRYRHRPACQRPLQENFPTVDTAATHPVLYHARAPRR